MAPARSKKSATTKSPAQKTPATAKAASSKQPAKKSAARRRPATAADSVDEQLARYRSMRDFHITAEPSGSARAKSATADASALPFVIQKHAASHLHYDFRLGWNGVLKSWAVAKGPSYVPGDRRLAVQVEDHPMEYGGFEGIIPKGQYGGGTVMVWDQGTWHPQPGYEDVTEALRKGSLKFIMDGTKMHGKWTLVRMGPRSTSSSGSRWGSSDKPNWLLIKEHDDFERGPGDPPVTDAEPNSAVTGRSMDQIAQESDHVWNSKETAGTGRAWYRRDAPPGNGASSPTVSSAADFAKPAIGAKFDIVPRRPAKSSSKPAAPSRSTPPSEPKAMNPGPSLASLPAESQPDFIPPQLAEETSATPDSPDWLHEIKLDGYRMQARKSGRRVQLLTRKGLDWTHRMRAVADAIAALPGDKSANLTLDGEVVVLDEHGISSFANLQASFNEGERFPLTYFVFDLLHLDGRNTRDLTVRQRKQLLAAIIPANADGTVRLSEHIDGRGPEIFSKACELGTEGIISKRDAPYRSGRSSDWLKSKCILEQEFVIVGYTDSTEGPGRIGSLLLAVYDDAKLVYSGRSGTGYTQKLKRSLYQQLHELERDKMPFARRPPDARRDTHWVEPKLVGEFRFASWTADNLVRQAAFLGLREDKPAKEVVREKPTVKPKGDKSSRSASHPAPARSSQLAARSSSPKPAAKPIEIPATLRLTHPEKILDPGSQLTKRQLAAFYLTVAERMLPHIVDRPLSLVRCPEGAGKPCFFQKHVNHMLPPGITGVDVPNKKTGEPEPYITITEANATPETLAGLAQMGVLEVHPWGSRNDDLEHPDRLIFDLDPDESLSWSAVCSAAAEVRKRLKRAGLESFLKTTGGKGLHIVAPITPHHDWPTVKDAAHNFVLAMERSNPALYLTKMTKSARVGKIYLDYLRNERGATAVAPFSPRARVGCTVSLPLPWSALKLPERPIFRVVDLNSTTSDLRSQLRSDPWKPMLTLRQSLDPAALAG